MDNGYTASNYNIEKLLEQYDHVIVSSAKKVVLRNSSRLIPPELISLLIDEVSQNVRFKLWKALQEKHIHYLPSYIGRMVYHEFINVLRQRKEACFLSTNDYGELEQGYVLISGSDEMEDPASIIEKKEELAELFARVVDALLHLPPCQQKAMISSLKDRVDDLIQLAEAFRASEVDIELVDWPEEKNELQSLKASISVARKKLSYLKKDRENL